MSRFLDSSSVFTEFCQLTPPHTYTGVLYYFVSNQILKICLTGHDKTSIFKWLSLQHSFITFISFAFKRIFLKHACKYECCSKCVLKCYCSRPTFLIFTITAEILSHSLCIIFKRVYSLYDASTSYKLQRAI